MSNPDAVEFINLILDDRDPQDIYDAAVAELQARIPDWTPREGHIEVMLLEALALEVAELIYALNRVPNAVTQVLLGLFGVTHDEGAAATTTLKFHLATTFPVTIPAGTVARLDLPNELEPVEFSTDSEVTSVEGTTEVTVTATSTTFTSDANGYAIGTVVSLSDSLAYVDLVTLETAVTGGRSPEDDTEYFNRGTQVLGRLTKTLVLPSQFESAALEEVYVERAKVIDNWAGGSEEENLQKQSSFEGDNSDWVVSGPGTLTFEDDLDAPHGFKVARLQATGAGNPYFHSTDAILVPVTAGDIGQYANVYARMKWDSVNTPNTTVRLNVYFLDASFATVSGGAMIGTPRTLDNSYQRILNNDNQIPATTAWIEVRPIINNSVTGDAIRVDSVYVDIGANIPDEGPHPDYRVHASEMGNPGADAGYVTVAVYGDNEHVSVSNRELLREKLDELAMAALVVTVIPPVLTAVNIDISVRPKVGYLAADLQTEVEQVLTDFLDPMNWKWNTTVRRNEIISVVSNIEGVDFVETLTTPAADYTLDGGVATLTTPGTITVTVLEAI